MDNFKEFSDQQLQDFFDGNFVTASSARKEELLSNRDFKSAVINSKGYSYCWLIGSLSETEMQTFFDSETVNEFCNLDENTLALQLNRSTYVAEEIHKFLLPKVYDNEKYVDIFQRLPLQDKADVLKHTFENGNDNSAQKFVNRIYNTDQELRDFFGKPENKPLLDNIVSNTTVLGTQPVFAETILQNMDKSNLSQNQIRDISTAVTYSSLSGVYKTGKINLPKDIMENKEILDQLVTVNKSKEFVAILKNYAHDAEFCNNLISLRNKHLDDQFKENKETSPNMFCERFFGELANDVIVDLDLVMRNLDNSNFTKNFDETTISNFKELYKVLVNETEPERSGFDYKELSEYQSLSKEGGKTRYLDDIYQSFLDSKVDLVEPIIQSRKIAKKIFTNELSENLTDFSENSPVQQTLVDGVQVYHLKGEKFNIMAHTSRSSRDSDNLEHSISKFDDRISVPETPPFVMSTSLLSEKSLELYQKDNVCYGYYNIDPSRVVHASLSDSFSNNRSEENNTTAVPDYLQLDDFKELSEGVMNEITINTADNGDGRIKNGKFMPDCLICMDTITENEIKLAKHYNLPLVQIDSSSYAIAQGKNVLSGKVSSLGKASGISLNYTNNFGLNLEAYQNMRLDAPKEIAQEVTKELGQPERQNIAEPVEYSAERYSSDKATLHSIKGKANKLEFINNNESFKKHLAEIAGFDLAKIKRLKNFEYDRLISTGIIEFSNDKEHQAYINANQDVRMEYLQRLGYDEEYAKSSYLDSADYTKLFGESKQEIANEVNVLLQGNNGLEQIDNSLIKDQVDKKPTEIDKIRYAECIAYLGEKQQPINVKMLCVKNELDPSDPDKKPYTFVNELAERNINVPDITPMTIQQKDVEQQMSPIQLVAKCGYQNASLSKCSQISTIQKLPENLLSHALGNKEEMPTKVNDNQLLKIANAVCGKSREQYTALAKQMEHTQADDQVFAKVLKQLRHDAYQRHNFVSGKKDEGSVKFLEDIVKVIEGANNRVEKGEKTAKEAMEYLTKHADTFYRRAGEQNFSFEKDMMSHMIVMAYFDKNDLDQQKDLWGRDPNSEYSKNLVEKNNKQKEELFRFREEYNKNNPGQERPLNGLVHALNSKFGIEMLKDEVGDDRK